MSYARKSFQRLLLLPRVDAVLILAHTNKREGRQESAEELDGGIRDGVQEAGAGVYRVREVNTEAHRWVEMGAADVAHRESSRDDHEANREAVNIPSLSSAGCSHPVPAQGGHVEHDKRKEE